MTPVRAERERAGLSQERLAVRAGISSMTLRRAEQFGALHVRPETLIKIAAALGKRPAELLGDAP
jgi:transcriptional regulator with XRE-family HTH domain